MKPADKLIAKAAREILKPLGLFQVGTSRIWIDDNGYYFTVVEFQPSAWSKGAYLNVAISFLFDQGKGFDEVLPYNIGGRVLSHVEYDDNDEKFYESMLKMAQHAKEKIETYRNYSASSILSYSLTESSLKVIEAWNKAMVHYFTSNEKSGDEQLKLLLQYAEHEREYESGGQMHTRNFIVERVHAAEELLSKSPNEKHQYVMQSIIEKRKRLRSKAKYKKLAVHSIYQ
jgi:hypothetical protein